MARGRSVRLYLAEGSATGILTAEIVNWTGHVLAGPRARLEVALGRAELARTGIYLLVGDAAQGDLPAVYVGEGDSIGQRLRAHAQDETKDFWDRFVAVTSKDMNLTKAHVRFLEARLIAMLTDARQSVVTNRTAPNSSACPRPMSPTWRASSRSWS
ncbi:GIY-YIG nuclease family protein [Paracoccus sp. PARArs4]|uniref:GIY-YIG nuclease family protein n=1 Tax=Paracoccus sp. PARArs4 TaxID=2853442 RepID=UPI0024A695EF|nr:GIY-YIG nuclease family protein [Paracoccus sp. PARArs4]